MSRDVKIIAAVAALALVAFLVYKKLHTPMPPIDFQGEIFFHVEEQSENEWVATHIYTVEGKPLGRATQWLQIINLGELVTPSLRDQVDRRLQASMAVAPHNGDQHRLFGVMQSTVVYVYLMESTYMVYGQLMVDGDEEAYRLKADAVFDAMEWIPVKDI